MRGRVEHFRDSLLNRNMTPFKETRLYKWPKAVVDSMSDNPIDTSIAVALVAIFLSWALTEAWRGAGPLTAFADSWGDFGGSIIGGLVAFLLARLAIERERKAQLQRYVLESGRHAVQVREQLENWRESSLRQFEKLKIALGQEQHEDGTMHYNRREAADWFRRAVPPEKFGPDCVGRLTSLWPLGAVEATLRNEANRLSNFGENVWHFENREVGSYNGEVEDLQNAFELYRWCKKAVESIDAAMAEIAAGEIPEQPTPEDPPQLDWPRDQLAR